MARFIPLKTYTSLFLNESTFLTEEGMRSFYAVLSKKGEALAKDAGYSSEDFAKSIQGFKDPSSIIFHGWVNQTEGLVELLVSGNTSTAFSDTKKYLSHQLSEKYKRFVSPFLAEVILTKWSTEKAPSLTAFSYVVLLDEAHRSVVEETLFNPIQKSLKRVSTIRKEATNEQELIDTVKPLCSDEIIACVNYLSRASYAKKLAYVDGVLEMIRSKACTTRFANWLLKRMENVALNREHEHKIIDLKRELRQGELHVKNQASGRTPIRWRTLFSFLLLSALIAVTAYTIYYKPFSTVEEDVFANDTSFKGFTKEERIRIDSLLQKISHERRSDEIEIDPTMPIFNGGTNLVLRKAFTNETLERIYEDLSLDAELQETYPRDSCLKENDLKNFKRNGGIKDLLGREAKSEIMLKNESSYGMLVYVGEDKKGGEVYSTFVAPQETITFKMNASNTLNIATGNHYQAFKAPPNALKEELPSDQFNYHFCATDQNYAESIHSTYQLERERKRLSKLMLTGDNSGYVYLVDVHEVLNEY